MAGYLLHEDASIVCDHSGQAKPTITDEHVKVDGHKIVTQSSPYSISGCTYPPNSGGPCATATWVRPATRVTVTEYRLPVLFVDSLATCAPTGTGLNIVSTQTRVKVT